MVMPHARYLPPWQGKAVSADGLDKSRRFWPLTALGGAGGRGAGYAERLSRSRMETPSVLAVVAAR